MGTIKLILVFGLLGCMVYVGAEVIPPYFANYEFQDSLDTEARLGTYSTKGDDVIRDAVFRRAQELEIPVAKEKIKVQRTGSAGNGSVSIETNTPCTWTCPAIRSISISTHKARIRPRFRSSQNTSAKPSERTPMSAGAFRPHVTSAVTKCPRHA